MNFKRKLENALCLFLASKQTGSTWAGIPLLHSQGHAVGQEVSAPDDESATPPLPYVSIIATAVADPEMPEVFEARIELDFNTDALTTAEERSTVAAQLAAIHQVIIAPVDEDQTWSDGNPVGGQFLAFANHPTSGSDTRNAAARPLHLYYLWPDSDPSSLASAERSFNHTLVYQVIGQDMDDRE